MVSFFVCLGGDIFALVRVNAIPLVTFCDLLWRIPYHVYWWGFHPEDPSCHKYRRPLTPWFSVLVLSPPDLAL